MKYWWRFLYWLKHPSCWLRHHWGFVECYEAEDGTFFTFHQCYECYAVREVA